MKHDRALALLALLPMLASIPMAFAQEGGPTHANSQADWTVILILGAVVAFAVLFVVRGKTNKKDD